MTQEHDEDGRFKGRTPMSPKLQATLIAAFRRGASFRQAAAVAKIPKPTLDTWLRRGERDWVAWNDEERDDKTAGAAFFEEVGKAISERELAWLDKVVGEEGKGNGWQRFAWALERTRPDEFALRSDIKRVEITGAGGGAIKAEVDSRAILAVLQGAGVVQLEDGQDRPRRALASPPKILAEPGSGEPAASGVPDP